MSGRFSTCLTPANQCGLSETERLGLRQAVAKLGSCYQNVEFVPDITPEGFFVKGCSDPIQFQSAYLYQENGQPISATEMTAFALEAVSITCDGALVGQDQSRVVSAAMEYVYFQNYTDGVSTSYVAVRRNDARGSTLTVETSKNVIDLTPLFRDTLNLGQSGKIELTGFGSELTATGLRITGYIERSSQVATRLAFEVSQKAGHWRLLVY